MADIVSRKACREQRPAAGRQPLAYDSTKILMVHHIQWLGGRERQISHKEPDGLTWERVRGSGRDGGITSQ